jgi:catechol 2,3-dioxygenase-like lactoylglutathione lyase family enzyme
MIDHVSLQVADVERSAAFYAAVLPALGGRELMAMGDVRGFGADRPEFWIGGQHTGAGFRETHVAFSARDREAVHAFERAAVAAGAEILHVARLWPEYHPDYYATFVRDPDGNNVEAVCHRPG